jgi:hypothetical protein
MEIFRTLVPVPPSSVKLHYGTRMMLLGSCFSEYIGNKLVETKFIIDLNPFGIVFNPMSIAIQLEKLMDCSEYKSDDLFLNEGVWCSFDHHSRFSGTDIGLCLKTINDRLKGSSQNLKSTEVLFLTFGTSFVYSLKATQQLVSNCHKVPEKEFERKMTTVEDIVLAYNTLIDKLLAFNPNLQIVFTVSPIRHWKDGAHENQLSKATLLLAINQICRSYQNTHYFPSYEIVMDDLRDYRFYAEDMLHPNTLAINYIWNKFKECFMETETALLMKEIEKVIQASKHKPFNIQTETFQSFARQFYDKIQYLKVQYNISFEAEENYFKSFLVAKS